MSHQRVTTGGLHPRKHLYVVSPTGQSMLGSALDYPTSGENGPRAVLVGGGLVFLSVVFALAGALFLPFFGIALLCHLVVRGYYVRVLRLTTGDPGAEAPAFEQWGDLLVDGVKAGVIMVAYALPALMLVGVVAWGQVASAVDSPTVLFGVLRTLTGLSVLLLLLYLLAAAYLLPAAVASFAHAGQLRAAVNHRVLRGALSEDYAVAWVVSLLFQLVALPIAVLFQTLVVGFVVQFFVGVATRRVWGRGFGAALGLEAAVDRTTAEASASKSDSADLPGPEQRDTATDATRLPADQRAGPGQARVNGDGKGSRAVPWGPNTGDERHQHIDRVSDGRRGG